MRPVTEILLVLSVVVVMSAAAPAIPPPRQVFRGQLEDHPDHPDHSDHNDQVKILDQHFDIEGDVIKYGFKTSDETEVDQDIQIRRGRGDNDDEQISWVEMSGMYSFVSPDGVPHRVEYTAGRDGFQAVVDGQPVGQPGIDSANLAIPPVSTFERGNFQ